jgi:hypothetical protein
MAETPTVIHHGGEPLAHTREGQHTARVDRCIGLNRSAALLEPKFKRNERRLQLRRIADATAGNRAEAKLLFGWTDFVSPIRPDGS